MQDFTVAITYDPESRYWVATCEALGLVSEAPAYEALIQRVWQSLPNSTPCMAMAMKKTTSASIFISYKKRTRPSANGQRILRAT